MLALLLSLIWSHLAVVSEGYDFGPIVNTSVAVAVLAFMLVKLEPRLRAIESSIDRVTRALMLVVVSIPSENNKAAREQADAITREVEKKKGDDS